MGSFLKTPSIVSSVIVVNIAKHGILPCLGGMLVGDGVDPPEGVGVEPLGLGLLGTVVVPAVADGGVVTPTVTIFFIIFIIPDWHLR